MTNMTFNYNLIHFMTVNAFIWLAYHLDFHVAIYAADFTYISFIILGIFYIVSFFILVKSYFNLKSTSYDHYFINLFTGLGLLGTIIGFLYAFGDLAMIDVNNVETTKLVIKNLLFSMQTAFYTTITGIICSLVLDWQLLLLDRKTNV